MKEKDETEKPTYAKMVTKNPNTVEIKMNNKPSLKEVVNTTKKMEEDKQNKKPTKLIYSKEQIKSFGRQHKASTAPCEFKKLYIGLATDGLLRRMNKNELTRTIKNFLKAFDTLKLTKDLSLIGKSILEIYYAVPVEEELKRLSLLRD